MQRRQAIRPREIREYAEVFKRAIGADIIGGELPAEAGIERLIAIVLALDTTTLIPYVLFVGRNVPDITLRNLYHT